MVSSLRVFVWAAFFYAALTPSLTPRNEAVAAGNLFRYEGGYKLSSPVETGIPSARIRILAPARLD